MSEHVAWYVSRATGIVAWGLLIASMLWGLAGATRVIGRARPWWMLGVHRFLGALTLVFVGVHLVALVADGYTSFGLVDLLVPFASEWRPLPVALGVVALDVLVAIELTSVLQRRLPRALWRHVHLASYGLFAFATVHSLTAGTDARAAVGGGLVVGLATVAVLLGAMGWIARSEPREPRAVRRASTPGDLQPLRAPQDRARRWVRVHEP